MRRSPRLVITAALVGVLVPTAVSQTAVSAVDQDLVVSATSGAAGTEIHVSSASCETSFDGDAIRYLSVRLLSGTAPGQVLAGGAVGSEGDDAIVVVPDWIDPTEPAVIEAACLEVGIEYEDAEIPPVETLFTYDPVAFDVEASPGAPVQARTYSRTSLQAGQAFAVAGSGCFLEDASYAYVDLVPGSDLTFPPSTGLAFSGEGDLEGGSFEAFTLLSNGGLNISVSGSSGSSPDVEIEEVPTDVPAGTYSSVAYCTRDDGATLLYEPELVEVTGNAPFAEMDITVPTDSRTATVSGRSCTAGEVNALVYGEDFESGDDLLLSDTRRATSGSALQPAAARTTSSPRAGSLLLGDRAATRALSGEGLELVLTPAADGSWSASEDAGFDHGLVGAFAMCGDPLEDGFLYDDRAAEVSVTEVAPTTSTTSTTTTTTPPKPASAVAGTPTYAG